MEKNVSNTIVTCGDPRPPLLMLSDIPHFLFKVDSTTNFLEQEMTHYRQLVTLSFFHERRYTSYTRLQLFQKMMRERKLFEQKETPNRMCPNQSSIKEQYNHLKKYINNKKLDRAKKYLFSLTSLSQLQGIILLARKKKNAVIASYCIDYASSRNDYLELPSANLIEIFSQRDAKLNPQQYSLPCKNPVTKLHICSELGDVISVREQLNVVRVDIQDNMNIQSLHMAVKSGNLPTVIYLVEEYRKSNINLSTVIDGYGKNILMYAMINSTEEHVQIVKYLVDIEPCLIGQKDNFGFTVFDYAICRSNRMSMIELLFENGVDFNIIPCGIDTLNIFYNYYIRTLWVKNELLGPILETLEKIHPEFFRMPLNKMPISLYPECIDHFIHTGRSEDIIELLKTFMNKGGDINYILPNNETLLFSAIRQRNFTFVLKMIEMGADVNFKNSASHTPLSVAIELFCDNIVHVLSENTNIDLNTYLFNNRETYLHLVIKTKYLFGLKCLFGKLFWDRDKSTVFGLSLIDYCVAFDFKEAIDIIMPNNNFLKRELVEQYSLGISQRMEQYMRSLMNVAKYGILSRQKIYDLGLKCAYSHDPKEHSLEKVPNQICVNLITKKRAIKQSVTACYCGSLSVVIERQNDSIRRSESKITANAIYEFSRRANASFMVVTSRQKLLQISNSDQYLPSTDHPTVECKLNEINPHKIDLILFPSCIHPYKERIRAIFDSDIDVIFLSDIKNCHFVPKPKTIYVEFVHYSKEAIYYKSQLVEAFCPAYGDSIFLEEYFDLVGGNIFTHIVRADESVVLSNSKDDKTQEPYDDSISETQRSSYNLEVRLQRLRLSHEASLLDKDVESLDKPKF